MLVETVVSAALIAVVFLATMNGIDAASRASERGKERSVAGQLAQQDMARMRELAARDIEELLTNPSAPTCIAGDPDPCKIVAGKKYTITSTAEYVSDVSTVVSCSTADTASAGADYIRMISRVWGPGIAETRIISYLLPAIAQPSIQTGAVAIYTKDRNGVALQSIPITVTEDGGGSKSGTTNDLGCVLFNVLTAGTWYAKSPGNPRVDVNGNGAGTGDPTRMVDVTAGGTKTVTFKMDFPGTGAATLETYSPRTNVAQNITSSTPNVSALVGPVVVQHSELDALPVTGFRFFSTPTLARLFPFTASYQVFAGTCGDNNPPAPVPTLQVDPSAINLVPSANLRLPTFSIKAVNSSNAPLKEIEIAVQPTSSRCAVADKWYVIPGETKSPGVVNPDGVVASPIPYGDWNVCLRNPNATGGTSYTLASGLPNNNPNGTTHTVTVFTKKSDGVSNCVPTTWDPQTIDGWEQ